MPTDFRETHKAKHLFTLWAPTYRWLFLSGICTASLCICPCTLVGLMIQLQLFTLQDRRMRREQEDWEQELQSNNGLIDTAQTLGFKVKEIDRGRLDGAMTRPARWREPSGGLDMVMLCRCNNRVEHQYWSAAGINEGPSPAWFCWCFVVVNLTDIRQMKRLAASVCLWKSAAFQNQAQ